MTTRTRRRTASGAGLPAGKRGVALILVLTVIAILTSIGVDFSYNSRVSLKLAENARDGMRAYYLARSAVNLSRLLLHYQKQLDGAGALAANALGQLSGGGIPGMPPPTGAGAAAPPSLGIRLWELVPIDSNAFGLLISGAGADAIGADGTVVGRER